MRVYNNLHINPGSDATVSVGAHGQAVTDLQEALVNAGFDPNGVDGVFGQGTRNAVIAFQHAHGLSADGIVGPNTWRALASAANAPSSSGSSGEPVLHEGSSGAAVVKLQKELAADGFSAGAADGVFGRNTQAAVERFQRAQGLSVDGVVGKKTWAALDHPKSTQAAPAPAASTGDTTVQAGSRGAAVTKLQNLLTRAGYSTHGVDGVFGQNTLSALLQFQHDNGLAADGVCGPKTWAKLEAPPTTHGATPPSSGGSHPTLKQGSSGSAVTQLQQLLNKYGFTCGVDGQFGPQTRDEVAAYQYSRGLSADGVVGPQTWAALVNGAPEVQKPPTVSGDLRQRILQIAESQIGTTESGNNGGAILKYPNYFGRGSESWCADFASWVLTHAGYNFNDPYCPSIVAKAKANGTWTHSPQPGDLVLYDWDGDGVSDHVGIVKSVNSDGSIQTIEGNSDKPGTNVSGVWEHTRYPSTIMGYVNI